MVKYIRSKFVYCVVGPSFSTLLSTIAQNGETTSMESLSRETGPFSIDISEIPLLSDVSTIPDMFGCILPNPNHSGVNRSDGDSNLKETQVDQYLYALDKHHTILALTICAFGPYALQFQKVSFMPLNVVFHLSNHEFHHLKSVDLFIFSSSP